MRYVIETNFKLLSGNNVVENKKTCAATMCGITKIYSITITKRWNKSRSNQT